MYVGQCPSDDEIDEYVVGRLTGAQLARFEEHLLLCHNCIERVQRVDRMVAILKCFASGLN